MMVPSSLVPKTALALLWGVFLWYACPTLAQDTSWDCPNRYAGRCPSPYSVDTGPEEWNQCPELDGWTEQCHPTVSLERAACLAPLVVYARVLSTVRHPNAPGLANIFVEFDPSPNETDLFGILKRGAGLSLETLMIGGANSTYFTTWVSGFNDTEVSYVYSNTGYSPCGTVTGAPPYFSEVYFFLQREEGDVSPAIIHPETNALSINFTLSTRVLSSGYLELPLTTGQHLWIEDGVAAEETLEGNCDILYCCYNPTCHAQNCPQRLQSAKEEYGFECKWSTNGGADCISSFAGLVVAVIVIAHSTVQMVFF